MTGNSVIQNLDRKSALMAALFFIAAVGIAYGAVVNGDFLYDDIAFITDNPYIKNFAYVPLYFTSPDTVSVGDRHHIWRPLRTVSFAVDYHFWRLNPFGYHLTNLLFHCANAFFVFLLALHFLSGCIRERKMQIPMSMGAALLFAVHPVQTEAVSWIASRGDPLYAFFLLGSFLLYIAFKRQSGHPLLYAASLACFVLSLLSKESACMLPFVLILYDVCAGSFLWRSARKEALWYLPFFVIASGYLVIRYLILREVGQSSYIGGTFLYTFFTMLTVLLTYFRILISPVGLRLLYDIPIAHHFLEPRVLGGAVIAYLLIAVALITRKKQPVVLFCVGWFFLNWFPASNVIPIMGLIGERLIYLSSIGYCILFVWALYHLLHVLTKEPKQLFSSFLVLMFFFTTGYTVGTIHRNLDWRDEVRFWQKTVAGAPLNHKAWHNLGIVLVAQGRFKEGRAALEKTVELMQVSATGASEDNYVYFGLALCSYRLGENREAERYIAKAIEIDPDNEEAFSLNGLLAAERGDFQEALTMHNRALSLEPDSAKALHNAGLTYQQMGLFEKALESYKRAIQLNPDFIEAYNSLGVLLKNNGRLEEACNAFIRAIELNPRFALAYNNLGICFVGMNKPDEARGLFEEAERLDPDGPAGMIARENLRLLGTLQGQID
ncbi:MAG: tetratricopeptide repeat protein [Candidatus Omnitrophica bacterium]|nr:tetratricopeptide repeat protein [Candidatus Omnitrophota bacterium]